MAKAVAVVEEQSTAVALIDDDLFEQYAGVGGEDVRAEDKSRPIMRVLQAQSKPLIRSHAKYIPGAKAGMFVIGNEVFDGETKGVEVLICGHMKSWNQWGPGDKFMGAYHRDDPIRKQAREDEKRKLWLPDGTELRETVNMPVIFFHPENGPQATLISFTGTQLKKARDLAKLLDEVKVQGKKGKYNPAWAMSKFLIKTDQESNEQGQWYGWVFNRLGTIDKTNADDVEAFRMGVALAEQFRAGTVAFRQDEGDDTGRERDDVPF